MEAKKAKMGKKDKNAKIPGFLSFLPIFAFFASLDF
jgi:hypothetical protein